jgi:LysR family transcriptional regulator, nod-box dependent transcriptional activator
MNGSNRRKLRHVNLNLIPVLAELLHCRNVTHAAEKLHLTQSAVSASLKRLREIFDDDLLVMRGREMVLTDKAAKLIPVVEDLLTSVDSVFNEPSFDPATSTRRFRIVTADYVSGLLLAAIGNDLAKNAPGVTLHFSQGSGEEPKEILMGFVDMLIAPDHLNPCGVFDQAAKDSEFRQEVFFHDRLVAIESTLMPASQQPITLDEYLQRPHCSFQLYHEAHASVERATLVDLNLEQNDKFIVSNFIVLPKLVTEVENSIAVIPGALARLWQQNLPIRAFQPPIDFPEHNLILLWARAHDRDPAVTWLRQILRDAGRAIEAHLPAMN